MQTAESRDGKASPRGQVSTEEVVAGTWTWNFTKVTGQQLSQVGGNGSLSKTWLLKAKIKLNLLPT